MHNLTLRAKLPLICPVDIIFVPWCFQHFFRGFFSLLLRYKCIMYSCMGNLHAFRGQYKTKNIRRDIKFSHKTLTLIEGLVEKFNGRN